MLEPFTTPPHWILHETAVVPCKAVTGGLANLWRSLLRGVYFGCECGDVAIEIVVVQLVDA